MAPEGLNPGGGCGIRGDQRGDRGLVDEPAGHQGAVKVEDDGIDNLLTPAQVPRAVPRPGRPQRKSQRKSSIAAPTPTISGAPTQAANICTESVSRGHHSCGTARLIGTRARRRRGG